ncbi:CRISPR system precrRNA processing endoribonuclease RAMP protein Cas6 [Thermodesulfatator atlanticus]|uniref:CRISPR system precrRNA processing endoribonuclease RAMP protein Cas6 n=1 Tax=Thermodesulfatator atlanticus TaxID=501497 RepID=UPI0003B41E11|nr:CRISPR system precrRNA processing endoribonuclease RAMP protein Cas6 [Thermodesulfatator atlanticus]
MSKIFLPLIRVWFSLRVEEPLVFPRKPFSPLRGVLGAQLKRISCVARQFETCAPCPLNQHCAYGYIFETPRPEDAERLRLYPYVPHPFALTPVLPLKGNTFELGLTLVGRGIQYFPHFVLALSAAGDKGLGRRRARFQIADIKDHFGHESLYQKGQLKPPTMKEEIHEEGASQIKIRFLTPTSLRFEGHLVPPKNFAFHILVRNLLRRVSALSYFHAEKELNLPFKELIERAQGVKTVAKRLFPQEIIRYSARKETTMPLRGFVGEALFEGELSPFMPLLRLGELVHVGKNTSFGFGAYRLEEMS